MFVCICPHKNGKTRQKLTQLYRNIVVVHCVEVIRFQEHLTVISELESWYFRKCWITSCFNNLEIAGQIMQCCMVECKWAYLGTFIQQWAYLTRRDKTDDIAQGLCNRTQFNL